MNEFKASLAIGLIAAATILASTSTAHADLAPPDQCPTKDAACNNAGDDANQPGVCRDAKCTRSTPDGPVTYDCLQCVATAGTGGASNGTGGSSSTAGNASAGSAGAPKADSDHGGCSVGTRDAERGLAGALVALGLGALLVARRRR